MQKTLDIDPERVLVNGNLANCLCELKRYDEAIPYLKRSLSKEDDIIHPDVGPKCLENYSKILYLKKNYVESVKLLDQLIDRKDFETNQNEDKIFCLLSKCYLQLKECDNSLKFVNKALEINPIDSEYQKLKKNIQQRIWYLTVPSLLMP